MRELSPYFIRPLVLPAGEETVALAEPGVEEEVHLRDHWRVIRKHSGLIATFFLGVVLITALVIFIMTPIYTAETLLLIERRPPQVLDIQQVLAESLGPDEHDYYKTQYEILKSRSLAAQEPQRLWDSIREQLPQTPYVGERLPALEALFRHLLALHRADGSVGVGYHRFEHPLESAILEPEAAQLRGVREEFVHLALIAALLHDVDLGRTGEPNVQRTLTWLREDAQMRRLLAALQEGLYRSEDAGKTWQTIALPVASHLVAFAHHPDDPAVLFAATGEGGILKSTDGGVRWTRQH